MTGLTKVSDWLKGWFQPEVDEQTRWRNVLSALRRVHWDMLVDEDRQFIRIMQARVDAGLPILEGHGRRLDSIDWEAQRMESI